MWCHANLEDFSDHYSTFFPTIYPFKKQQQQQKTPFNLFRNGPKYCHLLYIDTCNLYG